MRCTDCTLVYSDPQPRTTVRARYVAEYDLAAHFGPLAPRKRVLFERRLRYVAPPKEGRNRLCDVGCADGQFLAIAREHGWNCMGVELNPPAAAAARSRGFEIVEGEFESAEGLPWRRFDLVTCFDCLEHTPEPRLFAERLVNLSRPTGTILIATLNLNSLAFRFFGTRWSMIHPDHFTYWNAQALERLFEDLGWKVTEWKTFGLGRDFVAWLDAIRRLRGSALMASVRHQNLHPGWDVNRGVLAAERLLNRGLGLTGTGVEIMCTLQRA